MKISVMTAAVLAVSLSCSIAHADAETQCGQFASSVTAAYNDAASGKPMFQSINDVDDLYKQQRIPKAKRIEYMKNVRNIVATGYMAFNNGLSESDAYLVSYETCMKMKKSI